MIATLQKWGHSLAVRIPKPLADRLHVGAGQRFELDIEGERLVLRPVDTSPRYDLEALVAAIDESNLHDEVSAGPARGAEFA